MNEQNSTERVEMLPSVLSVGGLTNEEAITILTDWLERQPRYQGEDARSVHYARNRTALTIAIEAMSRPQPTDLVEAVEALLAKAPCYEGHDTVTVHQQLIRNLQNALREKTSWKK